MDGPFTDSCTRMERTTVKVIGAISSEWMILITLLYDLVGVEMKKRELARLLVKADEEHKRRLMGLYSDSARANEVRCYNEAVVKLNEQSKRDRARAWHVFKEDTARHAKKIVGAIFTSLVIWLIIEWLQNR